MRGTSFLSILLLTAAPAIAQTEATGDSSASGDAAEMSEAAPSGTGSAAMSMIAAESIEDARVYSLGDAYNADLWESNEPFGPITADWADIGEVEDLIISQSGQVQGVTVDVGGFLGIGDNEVLVPLDDLRLVQNPDDDEFYVVTRMSRTAIEDAEEVQGVIGAD
ncbi:PRC-barrel domain-containing protein [Anianabacter salinae]|uniref:PRC-barrel domain-containing protein n=1 Tax=Anianabacter salinae TaxID=2851023 RepID=UPI00225E1DE6|nr:PRC-barrel domain-containing protein [Anianabacter salinae]MBV0912973.1 PRC-barrel domain-containing protein [Anianabacter salinae]